MNFFLCILLDRISQVNSMKDIGIISIGVDQLSCAEPFPHGKI